MTTPGPKAATILCCSLLAASGLLVSSCAESSEKHPVEDAAWLQHRDAGENAGKDGGENAGKDGGENAGKDAGENAESGTAGDANRAPVGAKLDRQQAEELIPEFVYQEWPDLRPGVLFEIEMHEVAGLWEALNVQLFTVDFMGEGGGWFNTETLIYHQGDFEVLLRPGMVSEFLSGAVVQGVFYYTYCFGSGIRRSHVGKLSVEQGSLTLKESGGFQYADLFVKASGDAVEVETGLGESFNSWREGKFFGTIRDDGDSLALLDASGQQIELDFPPPESPRRLFDS